MRLTRCLIVVAMASLACACAREPAMRYYMVDPQTGQRLGEVSPQQAGAQSMAQAPGAYASNTDRGERRGLFGGSSPESQPQPQPYPPQVLQAPGGPSYGRGAYAQSPPQYAQPRTIQPRMAQPAPNYAPPVYAQPQGSQAQASQAYAYAPAAYRETYALDTGDKLRIVVFGQDGISSLYTVDAGGNVTLPLIGPVPARGVSTLQLANDIAQRLKQGYVRDPKVTVEVDAYRPFFILGEVTTPGQYPYTPNMTAETAIAIAGGFAPRASKSTVKVTRNIPGQQFSGDVPLNFALKPGDTVLVKERWF
jgi:polysaccharide export outer membrane protein